jgi:hypothetical protein
MDYGLISCVSVLKLSVWLLNGVVGLPAYSASELPPGGALNF